MVRYDAGTTNPTLLNRLCDWRDHEAWVEEGQRLLAEARVHEPEGRPTGD
jgi:hypothetical protein